ncbi:MAG: hypothetical protein BWY26_00411 [Elusimicrobia bacterium ADurb.Bin231]|nr:MAG: hypothetical protein BWY26_00411 [Elusimicrobia bacterium ADurb.Bin231]
MKKIILFSVFVFLSSYLIAGIGVDIFCPKCKSNYRMFFDGGKEKRNIIGYCTECKRIVEISYYYKDKNKPKSIGKIYLPQFLEYRELYNCPQCSNIFVALESKDFHGISSCPKCFEKFSDMQWISWD